MKNVAILGCTGSIGRQALQVIEHLNRRFRVVGLASGGWSALLEEQIRLYKPKVVCLGREVRGRPLFTGHKISADIGNISLLYGQEGLTEIAGMGDVDIVVIAIPGMASVMPTLEAARHGKVIALASKEALVCAGDLVLAAVKNGGAQLRPVDSEHSAIFQCLHGAFLEVNRIFLTASGGPFLRTPAAELKRVTAVEALKHPTWNMGKKVTIDSATLMNKGLEVIEAHHLFNISYEKIRVVIHPESVIHSMVEFYDGSVLGQMGWPDMRLPIQYALTYPERIDSLVEQFDPVRGGSITFEEPDTAKFAALDLAYCAGREGGTMTAVLNAADEVAVDAFLQGSISFIDIIRIVQETLENHIPVKSPNLEEIVYADKWARDYACRLLSRLE